MTRSNSFTPAIALLLTYLFIVPLVASAEHHESAEAAEQTPRESLDAEVYRLALEFADLLGRAVELGETQVQATALQQRERDAAQAALRHARDSARKYVRDLEEGDTLRDSQTSFQAADRYLKAALETAGDAQPSLEGERLLDRVRKIVRRLELIYEEL